MIALLAPLVLRGQLFANAAIASSRVGVAVRRRSVLIMPKGQRPHPRHVHRPSGGLHDPADNDAIAEHVEVVVVPFAGGPRGGSALEGQLDHDAPLGRYNPNFAAARLYRSVAFCSASRASVVRASRSMQGAKSGRKVMTSRPVFTP